MKKITFLIGLIAGLLFVGVVYANVDNPADVADFLKSPLTADLDAGGFDITNIDAASYDAVVDNGTSTVDSELDWTEGNRQKITLDNSPTLTFVDPSGPASVTIQLIQDSSGSRTVTWPGTVRWPGGTAPTLSTGANAVDIVSCLYDDTNYDCDSSLDFQ